MNYYIEVLKKYAVFTGRVARKEYWMFVLFNIIVSIVVGVVGGIIHVRALLWLYDLAVLLPSIAVGIRRLHDTDRSGWWLLIGLIPVVGWIIIIVFLAQDGRTGTNQYGPNPKEMSPVPPTVAA